jgi:hypothetical protein
MSQNTLILVILPKKLMFEENIHQLVNNLQIP